MKKLIFLLSIFLLFSCDNPEDSEELDTNENYIKLTAVTPKSGSTIREPMTIQANIKYNISLNELEGMGFYISLWTGYTAAGEWYSSPDKNAKLEMRNDEKLAPIEFVDDRFLKNHKGDTIFYRISITKKTSEDREYFLMNSDSIFFVFD